MILEPPKNSLTLYCFKYFIFVFNFCQLDFYVSLCIPPWFYPAWNSLHFLELVDCSLSHVMKFFNYYLFKYFLRDFISFPSGTTIMQLLVYLMLSQSSLRLSSFFFSLFYFAAVIFTILSPAHLSVLSPQLLCC